MSIVNFAISELDKDPEYDRAYCVFDRDGHANFDAALRAIADSKYGKGMRLFGVTSNPCFEIWLLLHYRYTTASYMPAGGRSACERLIADLRAHYPAYAKGRESVFGELGDLMPNALERAERLEKHNVDTNSWNPSTTVHRLVDYLSKLKDG